MKPSPSSDFWKEFSFPSSCDEILKQGCTLEQLLDQDDVVIDAREQKPDVLNFLLKSTSLEGLLKFLTQEAQPTDSDPVKFSEILTAKIEPIDKAIVANKSLLDALFGSLHQKSLHNMLGPITLKVITSLIATNKEAVLSYMGRTPTILDDALGHLHHTCISDFFVECITSSTIQTEFIQWLHQSQFAKKIVSKFSSEWASQHHSLSALLISLMDVMKDNQESDLMIAMKSEATLLEINKHMFEEGNRSGLTHGLLVLTRMMNGIIEHRTSSGDGSCYFFSYFKLTCFQRRTWNKSAALTELPPVVRVLHPHLPVLCEILKEISDRKITNKISDARTEVFGFLKLVVVRTLQAFVDLGYYNLLSLMRECDMYNLLLDLLPRFKYNTFFHQALSPIFSNTIGFLSKSDLTLQEKEFNSHKKAHGARSTEYPEYIPFLHLIGRALKKQTEKYLEIQELIEKENGEWLEYHSLLASEEQKENELDIEKLKRIQGGMREDEYEKLEEEEEEGETVADEELMDDVDLESGNDNLDYELDTLQILVSKKDMENFTVS